MQATTGTDGWWQLATGWLVAVSRGVWLPAQHRSSSSWVLIRPDQFGCVGALSGVNNSLRLRMTVSRSGWMPENPGVELLPKLVCVCKDGLQSLSLAVPLHSVRQL